MFRRRIPFGGFLLFSSPTPFLFAKKQDGAEKVLSLDPATITYRPKKFCNSEVHRSSNEYFDENCFVRFLRCSTGIGSGKRHVEIRSSQIAAGALDAVLALPRQQAAKEIVRRMHTYFISQVYQCDFATEEVLEKLFCVIEQVDGADTLKEHLQHIDIEKVVAREHSIAAHYFEALKRLGVDWKAFFSEELSSVPTTFAAIVRHSTSTQTLQMAIDICRREVGDDFVKSLLEQRCLRNGSACHTVMHYACDENKHLPAEFVQILLDTMKELYGTTSEMFNRRVFTGEDFDSACDNKYHGTDIVMKLVNASGIEQLCDTTSPSTPLQCVTIHTKADCVQAVIDRCRALGGNELVRRQLELTGEKDEHPPFLYCFYRYQSRYYQLTVLQYFIDLLKELGMDLLKKQLWKTDVDGNTLLLAACADELFGTLEFTLEHIFNASDFTDKEILAHFQHRNHNGKNVLMMARGDERVVKVLISDFLRLQRTLEPSSSTHQQQRNTLLKEMLEEECVEKHYTPVMYALATNSKDDIILFLLNLYQNECSASKDEMKLHLHGALRVCFLRQSQQAILIWQMCLKINDDAYLESVLTPMICNRYTQKESSVLACFATNFVDYSDILQEVLPYLVKFDLFDGQYKTLDKDEKSRLLNRGVDEYTPLRIKLRESEKQLSGAKQKLELTEEKLATALSELSKLKGEKS